jgi:hypothetical protein
MKIWRNTFEFIGSIDSNSYHKELYTNLKYAIADILSLATPYFMTSKSVKVLH